jgi:hypothetical protein
VSIAAVTAAQDAAKVLRVFLGAAERGIQLVQQERR